MFNFECLNKLCAWIGHPSEKLWPFEFLQNFHFSISNVSIFHGPQSYTHVKSYGRLNSTRASVFNLEGLDKLSAWIGHPSEMLWPFEFLLNFRFSISSVLIHHGRQSYTHVKRYGRLNSTKVFVFKFERVDKLCAWIGHLSEKLRPFEFLENFHFLISSAFIYHGPQLYIHFKSYGCLNWIRAFVFNFERLDILCAWIGHPCEMLWPYEFL